MKKQGQGVALNIILKPHRIERHIQCNRHQFPSWNTVSNPPVWLLSQKYHYSSREIIAHRKKMLSKFSTRHKSLAHFWGRGALARRLPFYGLLKIILGALLNCNPEYLGNYILASNKYSVKSFDFSVEIS